MNEDKQEIKVSEIKKGDVYENRRVKLVWKGEFLTTIYFFDDSRITMSNDDAIVIVRETVR